jgi:hypothetical protein
MLNSNVSRVLLCATLCCVPVLAWIAGGGVEIRVGGAESKGPNHFVVAEKAMVSIAVQADPGDTIWVYAIDPSGAKLTLILARSTTDGTAYGEFRVPVGTQGKSFRICAMTQSHEGKVSEAQPVSIDVAKSNDTDPAGG